MMTSLIDWLSLSLPLTDPAGNLRWPREVVEQWHTRHSKILCIEPEVMEEGGDEGGAKVLMMLPGGEVQRRAKLKWETIKWESVKSDSHQVLVRVTDRIQIQGSPARLGQTNNVFGSGDILECFERMVRYVMVYLGHPLPLDPKQWKVTRVDITQNYDLGSQGHVQQALQYLSNANAGKYKGKPFDDSYYWNKGSETRTGKAYGKGAHLLYQIKKQQALATPEQVEAAKRLLRLELSLKGKFWRERSLFKWWHTPKRCSIRCTRHISVRWWAT